VLIFNMGGCVGMDIVNVVMLCIASCVCGYVAYPIVQRFLENRRKIKYGKSREIGC